MRNSIDAGTTGPLDQVLLRVQPDRADFVDVCDLQGRPIVRAINDRLTGATQEDIRTAMSRRKRARKIAREAIAESVHATRHSTVSSVIAAQRARNRAAQDKAPPPDPPATIKAVRPDLRDGVERIASEDGLMPGRTRRGRRSSAIDFAAINEALGLGRTPIGDDESTAERRETIDVDAILSGTMDGDHATHDDESGADEGTSGIDAFDVIGESHAQRRRA